MNDSNKKITATNKSLCSTKDGCDARRFFKLSVRCHSYLVECSMNFPPSRRCTLQKSTALTKGTAVSSSTSRSTWNLYFFFFDIIFIFSVDVKMLLALVNSSEVRSLGLKKERNNCCWMQNSS